MGSRVRAFLNTRWGALTAVLVVAGVQFAGFALDENDVIRNGSFILTLILLFLYPKLKGTGAKEYGLQRPESWPRTLLLGVLYFIGAFLLLRLTLEPLVERMTGPRDLSNFAYLKNNEIGLLKFLAMVWPLAAFFEELLFRGFLLNAIADVFRRETAGWIAAVIISMMLFALGHSYQSISGIIFTGAAAIYVTIIYLIHDRNLWIPIIVHGLHNSSSGFFMYFDIYDEVIHLLF